MGKGLQLSEEDKAKAEARAAKFGTKDDSSQKALQRAQKFGTYHPDLEAEKSKKRAERFQKPTAIGTAEVGGVITLDEEEAERRRQRAERFNTSCPELEEERKRKRAERFSTPKTQ